MQQSVGLLRRDPLCDFGRDFANWLLYGTSRRRMADTQYKSWRSSDSSITDSTTGFFSSIFPAHHSFRLTLHISLSTLTLHRQPCPAFSSPPCPLPAPLSSSVCFLCRDHFAVRLMDPFPPLVACPTMISEPFRYCSSGHHANFTECRRTRMAHDPPHDREQQRLRRAQVPCLRHGRVPDLRKQERVHQHEHRHPSRPSFCRCKLASRRSRSFPDVDL